MQYRTSNYLYVSCICGEILNAYQDGDTSIVVKPCPKCTKEREEAIMFGWTGKTTEEKI